MCIRDSSIPTPPVKPPAPPLPSKAQKIKQAYKNLKGIKISDVELRLHEHLKNLDAEWIKRVLVGLVSMVHDSFTGDTGGFTPDQDNTITLSPEKNASGYILILEDLFMPMLQVMSVLVTKSPKFLMMANDQSLDDAPYRISFLGHRLDSWESSSLERLDVLAPAARHSALTVSYTHLTLPTIYSV